MTRAFPHRIRAAAASLVVALLLGSCALPGSGGGGYKLTAYFDRGVSLYDQSAVRVLGLHAGKITHIDIEGTKVKVTMSIDKDIKLPAGVHATIVPQSLIGERYVQLFPAWVQGQPTEAPGTVIGLDRTSIPVEPDEALAALKKFLDTLDPKATGKLVHNLADDLNGNGQALNDAVRGLADLSTTLADKDQQLADIIDHFDGFTATLRTREAQLGKVMDQFAVTTKLLADERQQIEGLLHNLAEISKTGLDLVSKHSAALDHDLTVLTKTLEAVSANLDSVKLLLSAGPTLVAGADLTGKTSGLAAAWDPKFHRLDLRNVTSPTASQLFDALGLPVNPICLPIDVNCSLPSQPAGVGGAGQAGIPGANGGSLGASSVTTSSVPPVTVPGVTPSVTTSSVPATTAPGLTIPAVSVPTSLLSASAAPGDIIMRLMSMPASAGDRFTVAPSTPSASFDRSRPRHVSWYRRLAVALTKAIA